MALIFCVGEVQYEGPVNNLQKDQGRHHGVGQRDGGEPQIVGHRPHVEDHHPDKFHQNRPRDVARRRALQKHTDTHERYYFIYID